MDRQDGPTGPQDALRLLFLLNTPPNTTTPPDTLLSQTETLLRLGEVLWRSA